MCFFFLYKLKEKKKKNKNKHEKQKRKRKTKTKTKTKNKNENENEKTTEKKLCLILFLFLFFVSVFGELNQLRPRDPFLVTKRFRFRNVVAKRVGFEPDELEQAAARVRVHVDVRDVYLVFVDFGDERLKEKAGTLFAGVVVLHEERHVGQVAARVQDRKPGVGHLGLPMHPRLEHALGVDESVGVDHS